MFCHSTFYHMWSGSDWGEILQRSRLRRTMNGLSRQAVYERTLMVYNLLKKECTKSYANLVIIAMLADECLSSIKVMCEVNPCAEQAPVLELLKKSMENICRVLDKHSAKNSDGALPEGRRAFPIVDCPDRPRGYSPCSSKRLPGEAEEADQQRMTTRKSAVEDTILTSTVTSRMTFKDVIGLREAKRTLHEAVVLPSIFPQLFTGNRQPWRRILLYGPPGTGKTRLAQAVAGEVESTFYSVSSSDLLSCWFGESEKLIRDLFTHSRTEKESAVPSIIFMDEIDGLCRRRCSGEQDQTRRIKTELLMQMDNLAQPATNSSKNSNDVIVICATNSPWEIDNAFLRRFQKRIYVPLPDEQSRTAILQLHCNATECKLTEEEWNMLGARTEGFSGSDLAILSNSALFEPIRDLENATHWTEMDDNHYQQSSQSDANAFCCNLETIPHSLVSARPIEFRDFVKSLLTNTATVTKPDLKQFETFTARFGHSGV